LKGAEVLPKSSGDKNKSSGVFLADFIRKNKKSLET
jgi:hypothetical protein